MARSVLGLNIFLGAFLMFQIQPLVGKVVTAQFGGVAAIWCVCIMFFQTALLAGYLLTFLITKLELKAQAVSYGVLMFASIALLNVPPTSGWSASESLHPVESLLILLSVHLAVPCILLSTISGLMQSWYTSSKLGDPYPLYGISNVGSLSALLLYPVVVEPLVGVNKCLSIWNCGYALVACLSVLSAIFIVRREKSNTSQPQPKGAQPSLSSLSWWIGLSALGTIVLKIGRAHV